MADYSRTQRWLPQAVMTGALLTLGLGLAYAQTATVCPSGCDHPTIQGAVNASAPGGTVQLLMTTPHTEADIVVTTSVHIVGISQNQTIVQAASDPDTESGRVFTILTGLAVTFQEMTIRHGDLFPGNGGGIWIQSGASATLDRTTITANRSANGGGIYNEGTLALTNGTVTNNHARSAQGSGVANLGIARVTSSSISENLRTVRGGGIYNGATATELTLIDVNVFNNDAADGGGIYNRGPMTVRGSSISNNLADDERGGGIYNSAATRVEIHDTTMFNNRLEASFNSTFPGGGGIYTNSDLSLTNVALSSNDANNFGASGGGVYAIGATVDIVGSRLASNESVDGGGIYASNTNLTIERSSITSNEALGVGAGIAHNIGNSYLTNVTIDFNRAGHNGGGAYVCRGEFVLANVTIADNTANNDNLGSGDGGGVYLEDCDDETARLSGSIIANNQALGGNYPDCEGVFSSGGFSLISDNGPVVGLKCGVGGFTSGMLLNIDPMLDNVEGFDATRSYPLLPGSPAIDAGSCIAASGPAPEVDQRGAPMPVDGDASGTAECDMGAREYLSEPIVVFVDGFEA